MFKFTILVYFNSRTRLYILISFTLKHVESFQTQMSKEKIIFLQELMATIFTSLVKLLCIQTLSSQVLWTRSDLYKKISLTRLIVEVELLVQLFFCWCRLLLDLDTSRGSASSTRIARRGTTSSSLSLASFTPLSDTGRLVDATVSAIKRR